MINITSFKDIMLSKSGGKPLAKVPNLYSLLYEAMVEVKANVDLPSAQRTAQLTNPVYSNVHNYPIPSDVTIGGIINLRPITPSIDYYDFANLNSRQFNVEEKFNPFSRRYGLQMVNGLQTLLINDFTTNPTTIHDCESLTANGLITTVGATTNLQVDGLQKMAGSGSISFDVGVGVSNGIQDASMTAVNLSAQKDILFFAYIPDATSVTGLQISLGQSGANLFRGSVTTDFFGNALSAGWNLIRIPKTSMSTVGAPNWTAVIFFEYDVLGNFPGVVSGFRLDSLVAQIGGLYETDYYSDLQFQTALGARIAKPTQDTDQILISGDEIALFTKQFITLMATDLKQKGATIEIATYGGTALANAYEAFAFKHPSLRQLMKTRIGTHPAGFVNC